MAGQRRSEGANREADTSGRALSMALREGRGHAELYDAVAPRIFQYCWAMLGPGRIVEGSSSEPAQWRLEGACAVVWETLATAVDQIDQLRDPAKFHPWLFALARVACQRHGFAERCPYESLPTVDTERPIVRALVRLPPSHRELLELSLRHQLSTSQLALVLGLDSETASQLGYAAVHRAADVLSETDPEGPGGVGWQAAEIALAMDLVRPPLPPSKLNGIVLTGCTDPGLAPARRQAAERLQPFGPDGFPLHRPWPSAEPRDDEDAPSAVLGAGGREEVTAPGTDRVTTADIPAHRRQEQVAEIGVEPGEDAGEDPHTPRGTRWAAPTVAGLLTVAVAVAIWGAGTVLSSGPVGSTVAESPSSSSHTPLAPDSTGQDASPGTPTPQPAESGPTEEPRDTPPPEVPEDATSPEATQDTSGEEPADAVEGDTPTEPSRENRSHTPESDSSGDEEQGETPGAVPEEEDDGIVNTLLEGIHDLLSQ